MRKLVYATLIVASVFTSTGCENWLDVNTNPNGPDALLPPELYLPNIQSRLAEGLQWDGRTAAQYTQGLAGTATTGNSYSVDLHGNPSNDTYAQLWRSVYFDMGYNLSDMMEIAEKNKQYDFVGVGYILRGMGWQVLTDYHGEIILKQAFEPERRVFDFDTQQEVYTEVKRLLELGIQTLNRTDGSPVANLAKGDLIYNGDIQKWKKLAYAMLAINAHRLTNKSTYNPDVVLGYLDQAFAGDVVGGSFPDAIIKHAGTNSLDANWYGPIRGNLTVYRQTKFITDLLKGDNPALATTAPDPSIATETVFDPRITAMLAPASDGAYRGMVPGQGIASAGTPAPRTLYNTVSGTDITPSTVGVYHFNNNAGHPWVTEAMLRFIQAEALYKKSGATALALGAYVKGIESHMTYTRQFAVDKTLFDQRKARYMADPAIVPAAANQLTLSKIMLQKYIAAWGIGFGFHETWADMRRYHYDPAVYQGFMLPSPLDLNNGGNPAYRTRPRFNSEYMWNKAALDKIGGNDPGYHTFETWFSKPE